VKPDSWCYPPELAEGLPGFGVAPRPDTPPRLVRDQLSDLYRFEIRRLREPAAGERVPEDRVHRSRHHVAKEILAIGTDA
jgi:hypothetical protein